MFGVIYKVTNTVNGKVYIGQTIGLKEIGQLLPEYKPVENKTSGNFLTKTTKVCSTKQEKVKNTCIQDALKSLASG
jgi:hypothetical protein